MCGFRISRRTGFLNDRKKVLSFPRRRGSRKKFNILLYTLRKWIPDILPLVLQDSGMTGKKYCHSGIPKA